MPQITVASQNPVKLNVPPSPPSSRCSPRNSVFDVDGVSVPSGVPDQPSSVSQTMEGARNRAENARAARPESDFWVGIEGGIEDSPLGMTCFARVHLLGRDGLTGLGQTAVFYLPREVAELVRGGLELGAADDPRLRARQLQASQRRHWPAD